MGLQQEIDKTRASKIRRDVVASLGLDFAPLRRFSGYRWRQTNPVVDVRGSLLASEGLPTDVSAMLQRSCQDCHSNRTAWPWYSRVAPASWVVASDVSGGRSRLNLDEWGSYSLEAKQSRLTKICEELKSGDMPDSKYLWIHGGGS